MSVAERALREDPGGVYGRMDFATRDRYRHALERSPGAAGSPRNSGAQLPQLARALRRLEAMPTIVRRTSVSTSSTKAGRS
jgi:hypothetical protein